LPEPKRVSQSLSKHHDRMEELRKLDAEAEAGLACGFSDVTLAS